MNEKGGERRSGRSRGGLTAGEPSDSITLQVALPQWLDGLVVRWLAVHDAAHLIMQSPPLPISYA